MLKYYLLINTAKNVGDSGKYTPFSFPLITTHHVIVHMYDL